MDYFYKPWILIICAHKSLCLDSVLNHMNPVYTLSLNPVYTLSLNSVYNLSLNPVYTLLLSPV